MRTDREKEREGGGGGAPARVRARLAQAAPSERPDKGSDVLGSGPRVQALLYSYQLHTQLSGQGPGRPKACPRLGAVSRV